MNCENVKEIINDIMDGNNVEKCDSNLFKHLAECSDCNHFFVMMVDIRKEIKNEATAFPTDLDEIVFDKIRQIQISKKHKFSIKLFLKKDLSIPLPIGIAFSMLIIILCFMTFNNYNRAYDTVRKNVSLTSYENASEKVIIIYGMPEIIIKDKPVENNTKSINSSYKIQ
jgi:S-adenosylmethionine:diacylglycerol 3-amino-3-carboxypropyl transferase